VFLMYSGQTDIAVSDSTDSRNRLFFEIESTADQNMRAGCSQASCIVIDSLSPDVLWLRSASQYSFRFKTSTHVSTLVYWSKRHTCSQQR
jgi:hypothetical protein